MRAGGRVRVDRQANQRDVADAILFRRARIKLPTPPGAGDEAALYVAEATDRTQA